jgi:signal transduction histidine kinase
MSRVKRGGYIHRTTCVTGPLGGGSLSECQRTWPTMNPSDESALKRAQDALALSEKQLRLTVGICRVGTWRFDMSTGMMQFDTRMRDIWGEAPDAQDLPLARVLERVHPEDLQRVTKVIKEAMEPGGTGEYEVDYRIIRADRTQRWVATNGIASFVGQDGEKKIYDFTGTALDITHRKVTEVAVLRSIARFKLLSETAQKLLSSTDAQSVVNELCKAVAAHLRCDCFLNYLANDQTGRLKLNACGGIPEEEAKKIEWLDYGGSVCGCVALEGKRIIAEHIQESTDPRTNLVRSFEIRAYACHPLMVGSKTIGTLSFGARNRDCFSEDDLELMRSVAGQVAMAMERMGAQEKLAASERHLRELSKSLEQRVTQRTEELERQTTQLRSLAAQLTSTEQRERKRLAALLHDDLQQLLVAAKMHLGRTKGRVEDAKIAQALERAESHLDAAVESARNLTRQIRPPVLYEAGLLAALKWLAAEVQERHHLKVEVAGEDVHEQLGDDVKVLLFECVRELLFNAAKHSGADRARVELAQDQDMLTILVEDWGGGFDARALGSSRPDGFGLFSIRERLTSVGGKLAIESSAGEGTRAMIHAPADSLGSAGAGTLAASMLGEKSGVTPGAVGSANGIPGIKDDAHVRVLVVDDHTIVREGIANILRSDERLTVVGEAADGVQAIQEVERHRPDVVLMDVNMPRMNGVEAAREIMRRWPKTLIVGLSVLGDELTARTMIEAGAAAFIPKSGDSEQMISTVVGLMVGRK